MIIHYNQQENIELKEGITLNEFLQSKQLSREGVAVAVDEKDVDTMLYCEEFDEYYDTVDDFFDDYAVNYIDKEVYIKPARLWVCSVEKIHIDADNVADNACDELDEDA